MHLMMRCRCNIVYVLLCFIPFHDHKYVVTVPPPLHFTLKSFSIFILENTILYVMTCDLFYLLGNFLIINFAVIRIFQFV